MKIRKIRYEDHYLFGDTEFDFTDTDGHTIDNIIIAGENGVGKSCLMNDIYELSNYNAFSKEENKVIYFEVELSEIQIEKLKNTRDLQELNIDFGKIFKINLDFKVINNWNAMSVENILENGETYILNDTSRFSHQKNILRAIFSNAEVNFDSKSIKSIMTSDIDLVESSIRSDLNLATDVAQLLVDVQTLDAQDLNSWVRNNAGKPPPDEVIDIRIKRFTNAFDYMFPSKKYQRIENTINGKEVIFSEGSNEMNLNQLSSGEKQIVFRGGFLLKNKESSKGALILIDEPELSLHPKWQIKSLDFFKKLFTDLEGIQTSQLIISTHSPFIIHNPNRSNDKVIILKKDETAKTYVSENPEFVSWTGEEAIKEAFSIDFNLFNNGITVFLEGETDEKYFNTAKEVFGKSDLPFDFQYIGNSNIKGGANNGGDGSMDKAIVFFKANGSSIKGKIAFLYDNDVKKEKEDLDNLFVRKMCDGTHEVFKKGVESLLDTNVVNDISIFYYESNKYDGYGGGALVRSLDKMKLCNYICNELNEEDKKTALQGINSEIEKLLEII